MGSSQKNVSEIENFEIYHLRNRSIIYSCFTIYNNSHSTAIFVMAEHCLKNLLTSCSYCK